MKRIFFFLLLALFPFMAKAQTFNVTSSATVTVGAFFYAGTTASTTIANSTLTPTTQISFKLIKPDYSVNPFVASTNGDNRCTSLGNGFYQLEIEAAQKSQVGLYQVIAEASGCINPAPSTWFQVLPDAVYTRDYISEPVGGWLASATALIVQASSVAASGGFIIPTTGMTPAQIRFTRVGNPDLYKLVLRGMSKSIKEPSMVIQLMNNTGSDTPLADENDFTHSSYALRPGIDGATVYAHLFSMDIDDTWVDGKYSIYVATQKDDTMVGMVSELALDPTPSVEIDESNLVTLPTWNDFVEGVTKTFNKWGHGAPSKVQVFYAKSNLARSQEGVSSSLIRAVTTGVPYGWESLYFDEITNVTDTKRLVRDYDASTWDSITVHEISETVENWADMEGVTISDYEIQ